MNKQTIITILLALVVIVGYGQTFTPAREDSIDFVITGETTIKYYGGPVLHSCLMPDSVTSACRLCGDNSRRA